MHITIKNIKGEDCACDALIFLFSDDPADELRQLPRQMASHVKEVVSKEFSGKQNEVFLMKSPDSLKAGRLLLVGLGKRDQITAEKIRQAGGRAATYLRGMGMKKVALSGDFFSGLKISPAEFIEGALLGLYSYRKYRKEEDNRKSLESITILVGGHKRARLWHQAGGGRDRRCLFCQRPGQYTCQ